MVKRLKALLQGLHDYYNVELIETFRQFRAGTIYFAVGLIIIYLANTQLDASLKQEVITLFGVLLGLAGFVIAMLAHMRMLVSRIVRFFSHRK